MRHVSFSHEVLTAVVFSLNQPARTTKSSHSMTITAMFFGKRLRCFSQPEDVWEGRACPNTGSPSPSSAPNIQTGLVFLTFPPQNCSLLVPTFLYCLWGKKLSQLEQTSCPCCAHCWRLVTAMELHEANLSLSLTASLAPAATKGEG